TGCGQHWSGKRKSFKEQNNVKPKSTTEPETGDAGSDGPRPGDASRQAEYAAVHDGPNAGRRLRPGPRRLWLARNGFLTDAAATLHRSTSEVVARPGARRQLRHAGSSIRRDQALDLPSPWGGALALRLKFRHTMALMKTVLVVDDEPQIVQ